MCEVKNISTCNKFKNRCEEVTCYYVALSTHPCPCKCFNCNNECKEVNVDQLTKKQLMEDYENDIYYYKNTGEKERIKLDRLNCEKYQNGIGVNENSNIL